MGWKCNHFLKKNKFVAGPSLPKGLVNSAMATSPDGHGVILFGGSPDDADGDGDTGIYELRYSSNEWTTLPQKLKYNRASHVAIPIP